MKIVNLQATSTDLQSLTARIQPTCRPGKLKLQDLQPSPDELLSRILLLKLRLPESVPHLIRRQPPRCLGIGFATALAEGRLAAVRIANHLTQLRVIKRFKVEVGRCPRCGHRARGTHREIGAHQCGANAHQVGPNVLAAAFALHYQSGVPMRQVPAIIAAHSGIEITQGALTQAAGRLSQSGALADLHYNALRAQIAASPVVNTDDTGWRTGAALSFLTGFFTRDTAVYQVRKQHRHREVMEVFGANHGARLKTMSPNTQRLWAWHL